MADQNLNVEINATYKGEGVKQFTTDLDTLRARAESLKGAFLAPVPPELFGQIAPAAKAATEETKTLTEAFNAAGGSFAKARAEFITLIREFASGGNITRTFGALISALPVGFAAAGVAALVLVRAIMSVVAAQQKLREEIAKADEKLAEQGRTWERMGDAAVKQSDLTRVAESALAKMTEAQTKLNEETRKDVDQTVARRNALIWLNDTAKDLTNTFLPFLAQWKIKSDEIRTAQDKKVEAAKRDLDVTKLEAAQALEHANAVISQAAAITRSHDAINKLHEDQDKLKEQQKALLPLTEQNAEAFAKLQVAYDDLDKKINIVTDDMKRMGEKMDREVNKTIDKIQQQLK